MCSEGEREYVQRMGRYASEGGSEYVSEDVSEYISERGSEYVSEGEN